MGRKMRCEKNQKHAIIRETPPTIKKNATPEDS